MLSHVRQSPPLLLTELFNGPPSSGPLMPSLTSFYDFSTLHCHSYNILSTTHPRVFAQVVSFACQTITDICGVHFLISRFCVKRHLANEPYLDHLVNTTPRPTQHSQPPLLCSLYVFFIAPNMLKASLVAQMVKCLPTMWETQVRSLGWEDPLEKEMATHSSTLAWKIPRTEEPGRLQSMGLQRVGHD